MDVQQFREKGKLIIDLIADYCETVNSKDIGSDLVQGYLRSALPNRAPEHAEAWEDIMKDADKHVMKRLQHRRHYQYFGDFPKGASFPSVIGSMLVDGIGTASSALTLASPLNELESLMMDWLSQAMDLPEHFLNENSGGGILQTSEYECIMNCIFAARTNKLKMMDASPDDEISSKLVAYCSEETPSIQKIIELTGIKYRVLPSDSCYVLQGETVEDAIKEDLEKGLIPVFLCATLGNSTSSAVDDIESIGEICQKYGIWYHVNAAYAGFSLICPEMRKYAKGLNYADSFNANADIWLLINPNCACLWIKDKETFYYTFSQNCNPKQDGIPKYSNLQEIPFVHPIKSLSLWLTLRTYGLQGIREYQQNQIELAKYFETLLLEDGKFEILNDVKFSLVCFRIKDVPDERNKDLLSGLNDSQLIYLTDGYLKEEYVLKFFVTTEHVKKADIDTAFEFIQSNASYILEEMKKGKCTCLELKNQNAKTAE